MQSRQKDYDELQKRISEFEARERLEKMEEKIYKSPPKKFSNEVQEKIDSYLSVLKKFQEFETFIRQLKVKKENFKHSLERAKLFNPDEDFEANESKLFRSIADLDRKIHRLKKKQNSFQDTMKTLESELPLEDDDFKAQVDKIKHENQLEHALKVTEIMFHEQSKTEELLKEALKQLKDFYICNFSSINTDLDQDFKSLLSRIQCKTIKFREYAITESNEDGNFDKMGSFYGNIVNLSAQVEDDESEKANMNETVVIDKANETRCDELIVTIEANDNDEDVEEDDEKEDIVVPRPPTPPKSSPILRDQAAIVKVVDNAEEAEDNLTASHLFKPVLELEDTRTPTPPQLSSIETRRLFRPVQDLDATFDLNATANDANATVVIEKPEEPEQEEVEPEEPDAKPDEPEANNFNSTVVLERNETEATDLVNSTIVLSKTDQNVEESNTNGSSPSLKSVDPSKVAMVLPMVPELPSIVMNPSSAPAIDRRNALARRLGISNAGPVMRRQPGVKSTSNLLQAVEKLSHPSVQRMLNEAPEPRTPDLLGANLPSYLKPTTASQKKFAGVRGQKSPKSNENINAKKTGVVAKNHSQK